MPLSPSQMDSKIAEHFNFEATDNVPGVLSTLTEDVVHDIVGWPGGPSYGPAEAAAFYEATFSDLTEGKVTCLRRLYGNDFVVDESLWEGKAPGRPFGIEGKDRPLSFRLLHVMEFADDGRIRRENVWLDLAAIQRQLPQA
jgi:predicted ester cyclase